MSDKVKGPASYFPSIARTYRQSASQWLDLIAPRNGVKHVDIVDWLKTEHGLGLGHGHANALVAHALAQKE